MKKFFALLMAICLIMSLGVTAMAADETPSITINFKESGHTYEAYQVFAGNISDGKLVDIEWGDGVNGSALLTALQAIDAFEDCESAADVAAVLETYANDSAALDAFADVVGKNLVAAKAHTSVEGTAGTDGIVPYTISLTDPGYYIVKDKDGSTPSDGSATKYILQVLNAVSVNAKASTPGVDKEITGPTAPTKYSNGAIGDVVDFQVNSAVPNMNGYNKYYFVINDTMDKGLTFNDDVAITIGTTDLTEDTDFTVTSSVDSSTGVTSIQIVLKDFLNKYKDQAGDDIAVTYSATINEDVKIGPDGVENSAKLIYSNDPTYNSGGDDIPGDDEPVGETPKSTTKTFVTEVELKKVDKEGNTLSGAKFQIEGTALNTVKITGSKFEKNPYTLADGESAADSVSYYLLKNGSYTKTAPTELTASNYPEYDAEKGTPTYCKVNFVKYTEKATDVEYSGWVDENGKMAFTGLAAGTYTITELIAPDGYNLLKEPLELEITWTAPEDGKTACTWTYEVDGEEVAPEDGKTTICIEVINFSGTELPSTGGMGTTIFYIAGSLLVVAAAVLLLSKKRMHA